MTESEFEKLARAGYNRVPVVLETYADLDTPLSIYLKLANRPYTYLLESVVGGERFGRYSFIGLAAQTRLEVRGETCIEFRAGSTVDETRSADPLAFINAYLGRFHVAQDAQLPRFCGGLVGYFGYDTVRYIERRLARRQQAGRARRARHPAPGFGRDRDRRQPDGEAHAGSVCPARQSRCVRGGARAVEGVAREAARAGSDTG